MRLEHLLSGGRRVRAGPVGLRPVPLPAGFLATVAFFWRAVWPQGGVPWLSWLERHTDNVGVGSSSLPGTTWAARCVGRRVRRLGVSVRGIGSVGRAPALQAGGRGFESLILHFFGVRFAASRFIDTMEGDTRRYEAGEACPARGVARGAAQAVEGARWMPRLPGAMKDATSCDKPRGAASGL